MSIWVVSITMNAELTALWTRVTFFLPFSLCLPTFFPLLLRSFFLWLFSSRFLLLRLSSVSLFLSASFFVFSTIFLVLAGLLGDLGGEEPGQKLLNRHRLESIFSKNKLSKWRLFLWKKTEALIFFRKKGATWTIYFFPKSLPTYRDSTNFGPASPPQKSPSKPAKTRKILEKKKEERKTKTGERQRKNKTERRKTK